MGEDGPTHQPIEQLASLRAIPGLVTLRPGDANEVLEAWRSIMQQRHEPVCLILSRQGMPTLDRSRYGDARGLENGAYVLADAPAGRPEVILMASGSEVGLYVALLAYVEMNGAHEAELQAMRRAIRDRRRVATCLGFGPRFLHSTGQAYKGGPNSGVFLQITCDDAADLPVPGQTYTFGVVKAAQARGDLQVLEERGRRALRVHLGADVKAGLVVLRAAIDRALA